MINVALLCVALAAVKPQAATFDAKNELKVQIPAGAKSVRVWFALPQEVPEQDVSRLKIECPVKHAVVHDAGEGNRFLFVKLDDPKDKELALSTSFRVTRREARHAVDPQSTRPLTKGEAKRLSAYLAPNTYVIIDDRVKKIVADVVGTEKNPVVIAHKLYDWVLQYADYWVKNPATCKASPVGSTDHCLTTKTGNCTDFHSLWTSLARAAGVPTRMVYGSLFKKELDGKDTDQSYHCWPEFYAPKLGWIPHDVALADIYADEIKLDDKNRTLVNRSTPSGYSGKDDSKVAYYFGNLDERRVTWSVGRDLALSPKPAAGPVNALPKAYVEVDGKPLA
jgi:hypothetical protein